MKRNLQEKSGIIIKKLLNTILDHNNSLFKYKEPLHQNPYLSKPLSGTTNKDSTNNFNNKLPTDVSKKIQNKKGSKESNENVIRSDSHQNANNVVYILGDSMIKHVNGRNVSNYINVKVRSHPGATSEDLIDYAKPMARKTPKKLVIRTGTNDLPNDMNTIKKGKTVVQSIRETEPRNSNCFLWYNQLRRKKTLQKRSRNVTSR